MSQIFSKHTYTNITIILFIMLCVAWVSSNALISITSALLLANVILHFKQIKSEWSFSKNIAILSVSTFFFLQVISLIFSPDKQQALTQIWSSLPFLIIPFAISFLPKQQQKIHLVMSVFVLVMTVSGLIVIINYFSNYEYYLDAISKAQNIATPMNHIRYSLMLAIAHLFALYFAVKNNANIHPKERYFFIFAAAFTFILLHILSVRSGLLSLYGALFFLALYVSIQQKKYWIFASFFAIIFILPFISYHTIPSFKNKIDYMRYDWNEYKQGNFEHNSDSRRLRSLTIGIEMIKDKPFLGHGLGQTENAIVSYYDQNYPNTEKYNQKVPHNQFLFSAVEMGITGILIVLFIFLFPMLSIGLFKQPIWTAVMLIFLLSCLVENTLESQLGASVFLVWSGLLLKRSNDES